MLLIKAENMQHMEIQPFGVSINKLRPETLHIRNEASNKWGSVLKHNCQVFGNGLRGKKLARNSLLFMHSQVSV